MMKRSNAVEQKNNSAISMIIHLVGNTLHIVNLINIVLYGSLLYLYGEESSTTTNDNQSKVIQFDTKWLEEGFCLPNEMTHEISGYAMISISLFGMLLIQWYSNNTAASSNNNCNRLKAIRQLSFWALVASMGHGLVHVGIALTKQWGLYPDGNDTLLDAIVASSTTHFEVVIKAIPPYVMFWFPLVKTYVKTFTTPSAAILAFVLYSTGAALVPAKFGFAYVQSILFGGLSIDQLASLGRQEKSNFEYALWPLLTVVPSSILGWIECTQCSNAQSIMSLYGHAIYDVHMVSSYVLFFLICSSKLRKNDNKYSWKTKQI